tara:strand:- start:29 stop:226 length:198 start_codon:yes stop_codon:yes gene_type:complete
VSHHGFRQPHGILGVTSGRWKEDPNDSQATKKPAGNTCCLPEIVLIRELEIDPAHGATDWHPASE